MRKGLIGCLLFVALSVPAAYAGPSFDWFNKICVAAQADPAKALAIVDAAGWMPVPQSLMANFPKNDEFRDVQGRMRTDAGGMQLMIVGSGIFPIAPNLVVPICGVAVIADPPESMAEDAEAFAAVPDYKGNGKHKGKMWIWQLDNGKHRPINYGLSDAENKELLAHGDVQLLVLFAEGKMNMLLLAAPTSPPK
jgi:hypothetical protein